MAPNRNPPTDGITSESSEKIIAEITEPLDVRAAFRRLAKGPDGAEFVAALAKVRERLMHDWQGHRSCEQRIESASDFLRQSKGTRAALGRVNKADWRDRRLSHEQRVKRLALEQVAAVELERQSKAARAEKVYCEAEIKAIQREVRDLLATTALGEQWRRGGRRAQSYTDIVRALRPRDASLWWPKTPLKKLVTQAKSEIEKGLGEVRWPITKQMLSSMTEGSPTIGPEIH